jgi:hypothetical protein
MENVAVAGSRIHESCRLCTMKNVAFLPFEPCETSPLSMRNVAFNYRQARVHEKRRFGSAENKLPVPVNTRHRTAIICACATSRGFTMENVALNHEKCRYCPFSSGNQERKKIILKKEQDEETTSSSHFSYSSEGLEAKTDSLLSVFKGFKLNLSASLSAGRCEERAAKLAKPHSR